MIKRFYTLRHKDGWYADPDGSNRHGYRRDELSIWVLNTEIKRYDFFLAMDNVKIYEYCKDGKEYYDYYPINEFVIEHVDVDIKVMKEEPFDPNMRQLDNIKNKIDRIYDND